MPSSTMPSTTANKPRVISKIRKEGYLSFIEWAPGNDGHQEFVHIASFLHPVHGPCEAYVKLYPNDSGANRGLVNEITGYLCAHALGVPQPEIAFVASIPLKQLRNPRRWLAEARKKHETWPAFCTKRLDGKSAALRVPNSEMGAVIADVSAWSKIADAIALDENIAHTDRHLNNLLRIGRRNYALIDNGRLATTTDNPNWTLPDLNSGKLYRHRLSERIWNHTPDDETISRILDAATNHYPALEIVRDELNYWCDLLLTDNDKDAFSAFIAQRTQNIEALLRKRYHRLL